MNTPTTTETAHGLCFDLAEPDPEIIDIRDIAAHLSKINRFSGATRPDWPGYTVAEHSVLVMHYLETLYPGETALHLHGLLHDAHEAYTGDITSPMKNLPGMREVLAPVQEKIQRAIYAALDLDAPTGGESQAVHQADMVVLRLEAAYLMESRGTGEQWSRLPTLDKVAMGILLSGTLEEPLDHEEANTRFLHAYGRLSGKEAPGRKPYSSYREFLVWAQGQALKHEPGNGVRKFKPDSAPQGELLWQNLGNAKHWNARR